MERQSANGSKAALCVDGILLCVHCSIEPAPSAILSTGLSGQGSDSEDYAGAAAAVGST